MNAPVKITPAPVRKSILVNASQTRAFEVFTARFNSWWPRTHHIGAAEMKEAIVEPRAGGRWYEKSVDGSECDWGKVLVWEPPSRIVLSWKINSKFQYEGALDSEVEVRFTPEASGTRVDLEHRITAADAEEIRASVDSPRGWGLVLEQYAQAVAGG